MIELYIITGLVIFTIACILNQKDCMKFTESEFFAATILMSLAWPVILILALRRRFKE